MAQAAWIAGCSKPTAPPPATTQPTSTSAASARDVTVDPERIPLARGWDSWSRDEALARLAADQDAISAALRLVRLAEARSPATDEPLSAATVRGLRVLRVGEQRWAIGSAGPAPREIRSPLVIESTGVVARPMDDPGEATLFVAEDPEVFPHLLVDRTSVTIYGDAPRRALTLKTGEALHFEVRTRNEFPYVSLALTEHSDDGQPIQAAEYRWDPFELAFAGPLSDKLPPPHEGRFELDLAQSRALIPVGGEIEVKPADPPKRQPDRPVEPEPL